ncbi:MAG: DUF4065 domain-containing protein [Candidatus Sabulitectum sp.]|nr:DUF4065 domain-containing protein [Candidatus Sabulitectum sp.]
MGIKFCPICEEDLELTEIRCKEDIKVRGEVFQVDAHYYRCPGCGEEFDTSNSDHDSLAEAYKMYREKKSMLSPLAIREFRYQYELTQKELTTLLGWGAVTLSRYENGALQNLSHDRELQEANTPAGLLKLIELTPDALSVEKRERLKSILLSERGKRSSILYELESALSAVRPGITNGFKRFNLEKYFGAVEFLCSRGGVLKTKLNKLLFYADFIHFKNNQVSITGSQYAALPYGPVPNDYKKLLAIMEEDLSIIETEEVAYPGNDYVGEKLAALSCTNIESLSELELFTLERINAFFGTMNSTEITEESHKEKGWQETGRAKLISYKYAEAISITI